MLKSLPTEGLHKLTARKLWVGAGTRDLDDETQDPNRGLDDDQAIRRAPTNRTFLNLSQVKKAVDHIVRLPVPGETIHAVCSGRYSLWSLIPSVLQLSPSQKIADLYLATLSFSNDNATELLGMLERGTVGRVTVIVSHYFAHTNKYIYDPIAAALTARGQRIMALRTHAKIILLKMTDGICFTVEGSANLRSCKNIEQFTFTNDPDLYAFHAGWIESVFAQDKHQ